MEILCSNRKLRAALEDEAVCRKQYGAEMAKKITLRVSALRSAESMGTFWPPMSGPERCHLLKGDLAGTFSVDLKHPFRLLFVAVDVPKPEPEDERERWMTIRAIDIVGVEDTHG